VKNEIVKDTVDQFMWGFQQHFRFFAGTATPIGDYEVHTCAGVPTEALNSAPALDESVVDRVYVGRSLQHEVIAECLRRADLAMYLPEPGADLYPLGAPTEDIVKAAAVRLIDGTVYRVTGTPADLLHAVNAFVSLSYERAGAGGHLVPTLLIFGDRDFSPLPDVAEMFELLPNAQLAGSPGRRTSA
jgi:pimeloyl-ACP methyl ester carboxylesterase